MYSNSELSASALLLILFTTIGCSQEKPVPRQAAIKVVTAIVESVDYIEEFSVTGEILARDVTVYSFPGSGRVVDIFVDVGDAVVAGDELARLDDTTLQANVIAAKAAVASANAQRELAYVQFDRQRSLMVRGFTTRSELEGAETALSTATGSQTSAKAELDRASDMLHRAVLRATQNGVVTQRFADPGEIVQLAQQIVEVATSIDRDAIFDVPEAILHRQSVDQPVQLHLLSNPAISATAEVIETSPTVNPLDGTIKIRVRVDNPTDIMPVGSAVLGMAYTPPLSAFRLPWTALDSSSAQPIVWVVNAVSGVAEPRVVEIQDFKREAAIIIGGLQAGERVVSAGIQFLKSGEVLKFEKPLGVN